MRNNIFAIRTIRQKILLGFFTLIGIFAAYGVYSILIITQNTQRTEASKEIIDPSLDAIRDLKLTVANSQKLTFVWIYSPPKTATIEQDKQALRDIHSRDYPKLKENLLELMKNWEDEEQRALMDSIFENMREFLDFQKKAMNTLSDADIDLYNDPSIKFEMDALVENSISPKAIELTQKLQILEEKKRQDKTVTQSTLIESSSNLRLQTILLIVVLTIMGIITAFLITGNIVQPINYINRVISQLGKGELPENKRTRFRRDEIGQMAAAMDKLISGLRSTSLFAESIGKGQYDAEYKPLSENDVLGTALIEMRNNLAKVAEADSRQNWATNGIAEFSDLLRKNNDDIRRLADVVISRLISYVGANQGGLFIVTEDEEEEEPYLRLEACYAWEKKKYLERRVYQGDGLTGQAWQEGATIYLTEVPDDYVMITSGLGKANPTSVLIVPLKSNEQVYGVVEVASFDTFEPYKIEFVERVAESIASTIASLKNSERTTRLLEESEMLAEQMRAQEEAMRQQMEYMQIEQEESERSKMLASQKEAVFNTHTVVLSVNRKFIITNANALASELLFYTIQEIEGMSLERLFNSETKFEELKMRLGRGESWSGIVTIKSKNNEELLVKLSAGSTSDEQQKYIIILDDINEIKLLQA